MISPTNWVRDRHGLLVRTLPIKMSSPLNNGYSYNQMSNTIYQTYLFVQDDTSHLHSDLDVETSKWINKHIIDICIDNIINRYLSIDIDQYINR